MSHDTSHRFYDLKRDLTVITQFWYPLKGKVTETILRPSKNVFQWTLRLTLSCKRNFAFSLQYHMCVFERILRIISTYRNKLGCHTTPLTDSMITNVSWRWLLSFDTPWKAKVAETILRPLKNGFQWMSHLTLNGMRKFSFSPRHSVCVLASILGIISIRRNKRSLRTMLQSDSTNQNITWWSIFTFHTLPKAKWL